MKYFLSLAFILSILTGCKKENNNSGNTNPIIGKWKLSALAGVYSFNNKVVYQDTVTTAIGTYYTEFKANGQFTDTGDDSLTGTYKLLNDHTEFQQNFDAASTPVSSSNNNPGRQRASINGTANQIDMAVSFPDANTMQFTQNVPLYGAYDNSAPATATISDKNHHLITFDKQQSLMVYRRAQ